MGNHLNQTASPFCCLGVAKPSGVAKFRRRVFATWFQVGRVSFCEGLLIFELSQKSWCDLCHHDTLACCDKSLCNDLFGISFNLNSHRGGTGIAVEHHLQKTYVQGQAISTDSHVWTAYRCGSGGFTAVKLDKTAMTTSNSRLSGGDL